VKNSQGKGRRRFWSNCRRYLSLIVGRRAGIGLTVSKKINHLAGGLQRSDIKTLRVAGLMSGTSADGIDVAIIDLGPRKLDLLAFDMFPYTRPMREAIFRLFDMRTSSADQVSAMNVAVGECFADALVRLAKRHRIPLDSIDLVGSHGQTIWHEPDGRTIGGRRVRSTLQIGEPSVIAQRTGITTVADFRPSDLAAGGQGAPLVPLTDLILLGHPSRTRAIQNIGGIANVTYLPKIGTDPVFPGGAGSINGVRPYFLFDRLNVPERSVAKVVAFDTGPGNMIIDRAMQILSGGRKAFDENGQLAARGKPDEAVLAELLRHPYLRRRPPKTTGRELFGRQFTDELCARLQKQGLASADIVATVTAFTARSIADAYRRFLPGQVDDVVLCGGGARNATLTAMLAGALAPAKVMPMDELGINADAKEAISFAILATTTYLRLPGNVPTATGAKRRVVLGKIVPGSFGR
jgi:anhydro-N-acetylmuramic acid kinase